jgi:hypothetical protein
MTVSHCPWEWRPEYPRCIWRRIEAASNETRMPEMRRVVGHYRRDALSLCAVGADDPLLSVGHGDLPTISSWRCVPLF